MLRLGRHGLGTTISKISPKKKTAPLYWSKPKKEEREEKETQRPLERELSSLEWCGSGRRGGPSPRAMSVTNHGGASDNIMRLLIISGEKPV